MTEPRAKLALTLSGGGARGAYEAGVIHYMRTQLPKAARERLFDIHTGSSIGAINTCFMASTAHDLKHQGEAILALWRSVTQDTVYHRNFPAFLNLLGYSLSGIFSNFLFGVQKNKKHFRGLLNTSPLPAFLQQSIDFRAAARNVDQGLMDAIALVGTNVSSGRTELFVHKAPGVEYTGSYRLREGPLRCEHVMASSAIPLIFPPILIDNIPYIDGGLRLNTPLSPAIQLGADKIIVLSLHHQWMEPPVQAAPTGMPSMGQVLGRVMNTIFLDRTEWDIEQLTRINRIIEWGEQRYGADFIAGINQTILQTGARGDVADRGLKKLKLLKIEPSYDIGRLYQEHFEQNIRKANFSLMERFLIRLLDIDPGSGFDLLSYITFMPGYIKLLLELGYEDGKRNHDALTEFMTT